jgi:hypothetical protein
VGLNKGMNMKTRMFSVGVILLAVTAGCGETMRGKKGDSAVAPFDVNQYPITM